jgi:hypothetical protein
VVGARHSFATLETVTNKREQKQNESGEPMNTNTDAANIQPIVNSARQELRQLLQQRADITKRIGTIKQTILNLCTLFGDDEMNDDDLREFAEHKPATRRPGLTQACRTVLRKLDRPLTARELSEHIQQQDPLTVRSSKNLAAAVAVILERLVQYGEARVILSQNGRRAWLPIETPQTEQNQNPIHWHSSSGDNRNQTSSF